jgi:hypothetical protein
LIRRMGLEPDDKKKEKETPDNQLSLL